ncbi:MAG: hypothetical protein KJP01_06155 [Gramella sp.]|nr:hypothetical protein [Christiangramia sp.]
MKYIEINAAGNFNSWNPIRLNELNEEKISTDLGQKVLFENEYLRIWEVVLMPNEKLPFRKMTLDYYWMAASEGMAISRFSDGKIILMHLEKGDSEFLMHKDDPATYDLENIGEEILFLQMTEFKVEQFSNKRIIQDILKRNVR